MNNPLVSPGIGVIFWMIIAFGILAFILMKWGWPVILKSLNEREKAISDALNAAEETKKQMAQLQAKNDDLLKEAKQQRENINYEKLKAMHDLKNQIATLSIEIAEKLIKEELSDKEKANDLVSRELQNAKLN